MNDFIEIYDTTLRDGSQAEGISFSVQDKIAIALKLDELGVNYVEGGWPGSNPKDIEFFSEIRKHKLAHAKISAFGSTRYHKYASDRDPNLNELLKAETPVVTIFGKTWDLHVTHALGISLEENLDLIYDSVLFLKKHGRYVIFDAEHFFDGYKANSEYAVKALLAAKAGGADDLCFADTNGGSLPHEVERIIEEVKPQINMKFSIHAHNDGDLAVANSIAAVTKGASGVQGTINGYGERCGNANLCSIIPNLVIKMGKKALSADKLQYLTHLSHFVSEISNTNYNSRAPFVGESAFAHKGGIHVNAVQKLSKTYEHIEPELVGNVRRILISELAGKSNVIYKANKLGFDISKDDSVSKKVVDLIKRLENEGYQFEAADASFELVLRNHLEGLKPAFELNGFRVIVDNYSGTMESEATIKIKVGEDVEHAASEGNGPVNALDRALKKALSAFYPEIKDMHLADYKVRAVNSTSGTAAKVRVLIESRDNDSRWTTIGVSENIIEASWRALVDGVNYKLLKEKLKKND